MQGYLDHAKSRPRFLPTMSVPPRQKRTPEGVQRHTKNVSSNFNSMVLAFRLLYGAVKTLHIWHHLADFANIMSFMQLVIWVIPHCVIILLYVHSVIPSVRVGFNARCWSAFGTHDAGPGRHCFLLSSFTALRDRSRCEYQGPGDIEVSTLVGSWDIHVGSIPPGRWCSTDDLNIDKCLNSSYKAESCIFMLWHVALLPIIIYTILKVDGSTLKRWIRKGPW